MAAGVGINDVISIALHVPLIIAAIHLSVYTKAVINLIFPYVMKVYATLVQKTKDAKARKINLTSRMEAGVGMEDVTSNALQTLPKVARKHLSVNTKAVINQI